MKKIKGKTVYFYVIEGVDKAGKTTFYRNLINHIKPIIANSNIELIATREPYTDIRYKIEAIRRNSKYGSFLEAEYYMFMEDREIHNRELLRQIEETDKDTVLIISDRYDLSTIAYQLIPLDKKKLWLHFYFKSKQFLDPDFYYIIVPHSLEDYQKYMTRYLLGHDRTDPDIQQIHRLIKLYNWPCKLMNKKYIIGHAICPYMLLPPFPDNDIVREVAEDILETVMF